MILIMENTRIKAAVMLHGKHMRNAYATIKMGKLSQHYRLFIHFYFGITMHCYNF